MNGPKQRLRLLVYNIRHSIRRLLGGRRYPMNNLTCEPNYIPDSFSFEDLKPGQIVVCDEGQVYMVSDTGCWICLESGKQRKADYITGYLLKKGNHITLEIE